MTDGNLSSQLALDFTSEAQPPSSYKINDLATKIYRFQDFRTGTRKSWCAIEGHEAVPIFTNEFWTSKQRAACSLHEISYRACFKPQLPRFFIEMLTKPGEIVYDPFMGRGTTLLEAALLGRRTAGCDINPLSQMLLAPRLAPPELSEVQDALGKIDWNQPCEIPSDFLAFYHPDTLRELCALRSHFLGIEIHPADAWIRMVATNRLTGHSKGFFSVYTLPPNQAVSIKSQLKINAKRNQIPPRRIIADLILKKSKSLLTDLGKSEIRTLQSVGNPHLITGECHETPSLASDSVSLVVTSPPFLDVVNYASDNWLRCWFNHIDPNKVNLLMSKKIEDWAIRMEQVFTELRRVLKPNGFVAFEVGEVRNGKVKLEDYVVPAAVKAGLTPVLILINDQKFTKTSNCWGVDNGSKGTNTNRIVLLQKTEGIDS